MRVAVIGSGAVGGYYGALLSRAGHDVTFVARGAHLDAIRASGLRVRGPHGEWTVQARAEQDTATIGVVDLALFAVKTYDNASALPLLPPLIGKSTDVLTLQNGVDSPDDVAAVVGQEAVIGGATYIATALAAPGVIEQTGAYRRIVFGEVFDRAGSVRLASPACTTRSPPPVSNPSRPPTGACRSGRSSRTWRPLPG